MSTEDGRSALRRVLLAYSVHEPGVGYCQGMNYLVALLLLCMRQHEEGAFWVLASLIDRGGAWLAQILADAVEPVGDGFASGDCKGS